MRLGGAVSMPLSRTAQAAEAGYRLGQRVLHPKFGEGVVLACEGQGAQARIRNNFV